MFILIFPFTGTLEAGLNEQLTPVVQPPPAVAKPSGNTHHSIETLVVVLAVITIVAVVAGIIARLCGGRHFGGNGEHNIEGWVERRCRSCIDGGVPVPRPPPEVPKPAAAAEEAKNASLHHMTEAYLLDSIKVRPSVPGPWDSLALHVRTGFSTNSLQ
ncbi:unnamed protein product [Dovyalis caffra]|uniref:Uncharacterized protein n=1 Tax=Dovyalis caffra TaxID=77055 RepID=A0AAV1RYH5_9ROSI|nr:unnamed protein product [Dovyalis caffra]